MARSSRAGSPSRSGLPESAQPRPCRPPPPPRRSRCLASASSPSAGPFPTQAFGLRVEFPCSFEVREGRFLVAVFVLGARAQVVPLPVAFLALDRVAVMDDRRRVLALAFGQQPELDVG